MAVYIYQTSHLILVWIITSVFVAQTDGFNYAQCAKDVNTTYWKAPYDTFLRDQYGRSTNIYSEAWGIGYQSCLAICSDSYST